MKPQVRGIRKRKTRAREFLENRDFRTLGDEPGVYSTLVSLLFDRDPLIRWRTVEALGEISGDRPEAEIRKVREVLRRLFWAMNDESGGIIWMAPEAAGWILVRVPQLTEEYTGILLSKRWLEPFRGGVRWAAYQLSTVRPDLIMPVMGDIEPSLESRDAVERAFTAALLVRMNVVQYEKLPSAIREDEGGLDVYDFGSGRLESTMVGEFLREEFSRSSTHL